MNVKSIYGSILIKSNVLSPEPFSPGLRKDLQVLASTFVINNKHLFHFNPINRTLSMNLLHGNLHYPCYVAVSHLLYSARTAVWVDSLILLRVSTNYLIGLFDLRSPC